MSSFGSGFVGGVAGGMALGSQFRDAWNESSVNDSARAKVSEEEAPVTEQAAPVSVDAPAAESAPAVASDQAAPPAPAEKSETKKQWAIGEGEHRKVFDTKPSDDEIRQWRYDTMVQTAGAHHANQWMAGELARGKGLREEAQDIIKQKNFIQTDTDIQDVRQAQNGQERTDNIADLVKANGNTEDGYIAARAGNPEALSPEQRKVIHEAVGLAQDPTSKYRTMIKQASILRRSDPGKAAELEKLANKEAAGKFMSALDAEDAGMLKGLYNIFPNGHLVQKIRFSNGNVIATDTTGNIITKPKRELEIMALSFADPDKAITAKSNDAKLALQQERNDEMSRFKDAAHQLDVAKYKLRAELGGGRAGSSGTGSTKSGEPDFIKIGHDLKAFGDDGADNADVTRMAHEVFRMMPAPADQKDNQRLAVSAMQGAMLYRAKKSDAVMQYRKANDGAMPTEAQIDDAIAPVVIDPITGMAARRVMANPADPDSNTYLVKMVSPGAPAVVQSINDGKSRILPAMIASIKANTLDQDDKDAWNARLSEKVEGLDEAQKKAVMERWGADGLVNYVTKYIKPAPEKSQPKVTKAAADVKARSQSDVDALGERPAAVGSVLGDAIGGAARGIGGAISAGAKLISEKNSESNAQAYENLIAQRQITDEQAAEYRILLAKNPMLQRKFNRDPVTLQKSIDAPSRNLGSSGVIALN